MKNISLYKIDNIPIRCNKCITRPKLVQTGFSNPDLKCPVCDALYGETSRVVVYEDKLQDSIDNTWW